MTLEEEANRAIEISDILINLKDADPDHRTEIKKTITELHTLQAVLDRFNDAYRHSDGRTIAQIQDDLYVVRDGITSTFGAIWKILGKIDTSHGEPSKSAYRKAWKEICSYCRTQSHATLYSRIKLYHRFLVGLSSILDKRSSNPRALEDMRDNIDNINKETQVVSLPAKMSNLAIDTSGIPRQKSYERDRPPSSPTESRISGQREFFSPVPDVPTSPTTTMSTISWNSGPVIETSHWAKEIFKDPDAISATRLPIPKNQERAQCYGEAMRYAKDHMEHKFEPLLQITFQKGMICRLYHRPGDHRARMLCESPEKSGHYWYSTVGLNQLEIVRRDSTALCLYKPRQGQNAKAWALLQFLTIERLVLFFCTFLSLRSHDDGHRYSHIRDFELKGEAEYFGGEIRDDGYVHAIRIYRDRWSKAVRLQASIRWGDMENMPVWTAFITHSIHSPTWLRRKDHLIYLQELRRFVFSPRYEPSVTANGEHLLEFTGEQDALEFEQTIREVAAIERRT